MKHLSLYLFCTLLTPSTFADFGEIDLIVRDSIENHFREYSREVDLSSLSYEKEPKSEGDVMTVETAVQAVQGFTNDWGLHYCTTKIKIVAPGKYSDLGSDCFYDQDN
ncbi:MAG: hypothetical protein K2Q26_13510 [Bdellovibrionales bacterium]|nr:hypothetical protein [Bdellovibrionales bacterium]